MIELNGPLLSLISFLITFSLLIPFINFLYKVKLNDPNPSNRRDVFGKKTPIFKKLRSNTAGTPIGAGFLIVIVVSILSVIYFGLIDKWDLEILSIIVTMMLFMFLGMFDDLKKTFHFKGALFDLRVRHKFVIQIIISLILSYWFISLGVIQIDLLGIPLLSNLYISTILLSLGMTFLLNAFNITDGVDGLSAGTLCIILIGIIALAIGLGNSTVQLFSFILLGSLIAYLYFNIFPARVLMGDSGSLAFGSVFFLLLVLMNYGYLIPILGLIYILEALSTLIQWFSRRFFGKKVFDIAPLHYHFENRVWHQTKVTMRAYLLQIILVLLALSLV